MRSIETAPEPLFAVLDRVERVIGAMKGAPGIKDISPALRGAVAASWTAYANRVQAHADQARALAAALSDLAVLPPSPAAEAARVRALPAIFRPRTKGDDAA